MKPKSKKVTFDASWFALLPAHRREDHRFMFAAAKAVKGKGIRRGDLEVVAGVVNHLDRGGVCD